jgi:hypothetical protein
VALVGVTAPPDFFVRRLLKKADNAPSFVVRFASPGVAFLTKETLQLLKIIWKVSAYCWFYLSSGNRRCL